MLRACSSPCINVIVPTITSVVVSKESIPVVCLIQQEGTLMSMLGYIVMTTPVSSSYCAHLLTSMLHRLVHNLEFVTVVST